MKIKNLKYVFTFSAFMFGTSFATPILYLDRWENKTTETFEISAGEKVVKLKPNKPSNLFFDLTMAYKEGKYKYKANFKSSSASGKLTAIYDIDTDNLDVRFNINGHLVSVPTVKVSSNGLVGIGGILDGSNSKISLVSGHFIKE